MPQREAIKKEPQKPVYDYEVVLSILIEKLEEDYGSVGGFINSEDFKEKCGYDNESSDRGKLSTYLTKPKEKGASVVSFPAICNIFDKLYNIKLTKKTEIKRTTTITSDTLLD